MNLRVVQYPTKTLSTTWYNDTSIVVYTYIYVHMYILIHVQLIYYRPTWKTLLTKKEQLGPWGVQLSLQEPRNREQCEAPWIAKSRLVAEDNSNNYGLWYITIINGVYKPTYDGGGHIVPNLPQGRYAARHIVLMELAQRRFMHSKERRMMNHIFPHFPRKTRPLLKIFTLIAFFFEENRILETSSR